MYIYNKIKTKNNFGLSARTLVCYNSEKNTILISVTMIVPNESKNHRFKTVRKLKHHKVINNYLIFKLDTSVQIVDSLHSIFNEIMKTNNIHTRKEFDAFAKLNESKLREQAKKESEKQYYSRTEVVELLIKAMIYANQYHSDELDEDNVSDWIEENL